MQVTRCAYVNEVSLGAFSSICVISSFSSFTLFIIFFKDLFKCNLAGKETKKREHRLIHFFFLSPLSLGLSNLMERKRKRNNVYTGKVLVITSIHLEVAGNSRGCGQGDGDRGGDDDDGDAGYSEGR